MGKYALKVLIVDASTYDQFQVFNGLEESC
jgi:hypothetical protein